MPDALISPRRPWSRYLLRGLIVVGLGTVLFIGYMIWRYACVTVPNAYALWNTADLVIAYMQQHDNTWPHSWDDLRTVNNQTLRINPEGFADLQERIEVDWYADPARLAAAPDWPDPLKPSFTVIRARNGSRAHWSGTEPNRMIWSYLQSPTTAPASRH